MKKQIGKPGQRKMYNTATATPIATIEDTKSIDQFRYKETLYKTERGDYFLHGKGGALTKWEGREDIHAIEGEALKFWLEHKRRKVK